MAEALVLSATECSVKRKEAEGAVTSTPVNLTFQERNIINQNVFNSMAQESRKIFKSLHGNNFSHYEQMRLVPFLNKWGKYAGVG